MKVFLVKATPNEGAFSTLKRVKSGLATQTKPD